MATNLVEIGALLQSRLGLTLKTIMQIPSASIGDQITRTLLLL